MSITDAWTTPTPFTVGEELASAVLNQVMGNLLWLHDPTQYHCKATLTGSPPSVPPGTDTLCPLNTVASGDDPAGMFNVSTHLATTQVTGMYLCVGNFRLSFGTQVWLAASLYHNASSGLPQLVGANLAGEGAQVVRCLKLNAGDTIGLDVWQNDTVSHNYDVGFGGSGNSLSVTCLYRL